ncbi:MAG TPA: carboxypeptidase regulatory-like domain-containing protein [Vicinamibacterales bacterium]
MAKSVLARAALAFLLALLPTVAMAQAVATGTISGVVRDASGGVLPGVTVEAASPALIEKVRTAVTDGQGVYRIVDLRPGTYTVTFTLTGFTGVRREGIELTTGFTATVNADLSVGNVQETITVSGAAPLVDTQNVAQQLVFPREVTEAIPLGSNIRNYAALLPGAVLTGGVTQDVGGGKSEFSQAFLIHGGRAADFQQLREGMFFGTLVAAGNVMTSLNPATVDEVAVTTASATAELATGGVLVNVIPRDGGNTFRGTLNASGSARRLQSDNLDDALRARGVVSAPFLRKRYDTGGGFGGPIQQDRVWFFLSLRQWRTGDYYPGLYFNRTPGTLFYEADSTRLAYEDNLYQEARMRTTWQATSKDKIVGMFGYEHICNCPGFPTGGFLRSPETFVGQDYRPNYQWQVTWNRPQTNRLLFEAGSVVVNGKLNLKRFGPTPNDKQFVLDSSRNFGYGNASTTIAGMAGIGYQHFGQTNQKFAMSYVTGSHAFKTGIQSMYGWRDTNFVMEPGTNETSYVFNGTVPTTVNYYASPLGDKGRQLSIGIYGQDQWTVDRLTLNLGVRFDHLNGRVPANSLPGGKWVPARSFAAVKNVPNWNDWSPRVGAAYDLFGTGRTAVKGFLGRYVIFEPMQGVILQNSPVNQMVTTASRAWTDINGDYIPQDSELGPLSNAAFGQVVRRTTYADDVLTGNRPYSWQGSLQVSQQLWPGVALNVGYFRTWYGNFRATENRAVAAKDFDPYCIMAPSNPGLPGGGGQQICGFFDVTPAKFGLTDNLIALAKQYGTQTEMYNGVDATMTVRFGAGGFVQGGLSTGSTTTDNCYQNTLPNILAQNALATTSRTEKYCHVSTPWAGLTQFKASVVYPLWWRFQASANYQDMPPLATAADALVTNAQAASSLGRNLAACGTRVPCTATVTADVVLPNTYLQESRLHQIDLRFSRIFRLPRGGRIEPQFDIFNLTNANDVLVMTTRLGPAWRNATGVLAPRVIRFGVNMNF